MNIFDLQPPDKGAVYNRSAAYGSAQRFNITSGAGAPKAPSDDYTVSKAD